MFTKTHVIFSRDGSISIVYRRVILSLHITLFHMFVIMAKKLKRTVVSSDGMFFYKECEMICYYFLQFCHQYLLLLNEILLVLSSYRHRPNFTQHSSSMEREVLRNLLQN